MKSRSGQHGFSLIELLVAMTVTLIVSGAIYGLLTSGGNAFRREPELADRQQNIRIAMDLITHDVAAAGAGLPFLVQVFTPGLDGLGPPGAIGAIAPGGPNSDVLELIAAEETCPVQTSCTGIATVAPGANGTFTTWEPMAQCYQPPRFVAQTDNTLFTIQPVAAAGAGAGANCPTFGGGVNGSVTLNPAVAPWTAPAGFQDPDPGAPGGEGAARVWMIPVRVARYAIANDPTDNLPALWRSATGLYQSSGAAGAAAPPGQQWQLVARGIEDLQVQYASMAGIAGGAGWTNVPPLQPAGAGVAGQLVMRVRITLSARVLTPVLIAGATNQAVGGAGGAAMRGELVTVVAPRMATFAATWSRDLQ